MKLVGIVGSNAEQSYNRTLLQYIEKEFSDLFEIELIEIKDLPLFNQSEDETNSDAIQSINKKIMQADGVIIATPEHNRTIPPCLKSLLEWMSFKLHPLEEKPVMIVGASYYDQGSSRAQVHLRQILNAPGVNAIVMPGNEFLLGEVRDAFDDEDNLKDKATVDFLSTVLKKFVKFVEMVTVLEEKEPAIPEDLDCTGSIETTVEGVDMLAEDWVEQASEKVGAVEGDQFVKLDRGLLTVNQIDNFLASMPMEITYADDNNQFLYYNYTKEADEMLASRTPGQVGNPLSTCHPEKALNGVEWVIQQLRSGAQDVVRVHVPFHGKEKFVVHNYQAIQDKSGKYEGVNEYILDFKPIVDWYLKQTNQELVGGTDAVSSASVNDSGEEVDAVSSASINE